MRILAESSISGPAPRRHRLSSPSYNFTRHVQFYAGYGHFFPGEFIEKTGPSRGSDFLYGAIQYTF